MAVIEAREEIWLLKQPFRISRGSRTEAQVVVVTISDRGYTGRGECVPIKRYKQSTESVIAQIESFKDDNNLDRHALQTSLPPGAARNALDCALWDLEAKRSGKRVWELPEFRGVDCSRRPVVDVRASHSEAATTSAHDFDQVE